jgi:GNAT superfamily N-acetyltransferase
MDVRPVAPDDELGLQRWHGAFHRGWMHERPWEALPPMEHFRVLLTKQFSDEANEGFAAYDGDELVGAGTIRAFLTSNADKLEFLVAVPPEHRRGGVGTALVRYAEERARSYGASYALTTSSYPFEERESHGNRRFADSVGFAVDIDEIQRMLRLPVDPTLLDKVAREAAVKHRGYRIETWVDEVPDRYLDSWLAVHRLLPLDAPMGTVQWQEEAFDHNTWAQLREVFSETGRRFYTAAAVSPDDEVVAYSDMVLRGEPPTQVSQWGTLVRRDHRGHRLGAAVKVANLARLQRENPDRTEVHTTNAEVNGTMIAINEQLGYEPVAVHPGFFRKVD